MRLAELLADDRHDTAFRTSTPLCPPVSQPPTALTVFRIEDGTLQPEVVRGLTRLRSRRQLSAPSALPHR